ncbi:SDR family oxidoreductase [Rhizobium sp. LjRoot30]|uniref:SDR family oxidoreductase n=1 Tax=Rhizobium sp. LjRoot30 TaxID=3342320 RepID=UPI003ECF4C13
MRHRKFKTALITGAARRIGKAIAEDLANQGFAVAIHAHRSMDEAALLAQALQDKGAVATAFRADLENENETAALLPAVTERLGPVDLLINNASLFHDDSAATFDARAWRSHFAVHVQAPSILAADFARLLPDDAEGSIVNIIDQRVWALNPRFYSYTLSKSALWTATQTMAQSFAPRIRANAIGPGPTAQGARQTLDDFQAQIDGLILKAGPTLEEFGRTIRFLYETPSITGQMIALDGGQHLAWQTPDVAEIVE